MKNDLFKPLNGHNLVVFWAKYYAKNGGDRSASRAGVRRMSPNSQTIDYYPAAYQIFTIFPGCVAQMNRKGDIY